jgi:small subunit ribosomal protein S1
MTWGRINHPSEMFSVGDEIRVVVLKFDPESQKVSLGLKQLQQDPWGGVEDKYPVGSRVNGKVVSLADYGAFVSLEDGVEGLIHVSEMSWTKKVKHPSKIVNVGDQIEAIVLDVDTQAKRISLGLKQIEPNPWERIEENYPIGSKIKGGIRNIADFGIFVDVNGEIDGLVHISDIAWVQNFGHPSDLFKKGDEVEAVVLHVDPQNERFSLGLKQLEDDAWERINVAYNEGWKGAGKVVAKNTAGAVVEIESGVCGLIPENEGGKALKEGSEIEVIVRTVNPRDRRFILASTQQAEAVETEAQSE